MLTKLPHIINPETQWMAPYAFALVGLGFLFFFAHLIINAIQRNKDIILLRQLLSYRRLASHRKSILETYPFYNRLSHTHRNEFEHRVCCFIADKTISHRFEPTVTDEQVVLIAAVAIQLSFGRKSYLYEYITRILLFDEPFQSISNQQLHKGEFNPRARVLAMSWPDFKMGMDITNDNLHLGLHEFTHAMHLESDKNTSIDSVRYHKYHQLILRSLLDMDVRNRLESTTYFRAYAFTNQYEFMAVLTEYFFETPQEFKSAFPQLFNYLKVALNYKEEWLF